LLLIQDAKYPPNKDAVRVDNYLSHSTFISKHPIVSSSKPRKFLFSKNQMSSLSSTTDQPQSLRKKLHLHRKKPLVNTLFQPGVQFVSIFCDDNKTPLPKKMMDIISSFAEKSASESINRLYEIGLTIDENEKLERQGAKKKHSSKSKR
jgi:hypothetical protein